MTVSTSRPSRRLPWSQISRMTRCGRRSSISFRASSLSRASRQRCPSSSSMPDTRSRMSASSSTTSMSDAIGHSLPRWRSHFRHCRLFGGNRIELGLGTPIPVTNGKDNPDPGTPAAMRAYRRVLEREDAAMLLDNLLNNGKSKAGPLVALGRDVRLEQPRTVLLGQPDAGVSDLDLEFIGGSAGANADARLPRCRSAIARGIDRLGGILDEIGDGLGDEAPVERAEQGLGRQCQIERHVRMTLAEKNDGFLHGIAQIVELHDGLWDTGERCELVDHALDVAGLTLDRCCQLVEGLTVSRDDLAVFAANALG